MQAFEENLNAVFCTDVLGQNFVFENGTELVIIARDVEDICEFVDHYCKKGAGGLQKDL